MIDSRLFPLLETLSASGLDWLVLDIVEAVTFGDIELEGGDALALARNAVKLGREQRSNDGLRFQRPVRREWSPDEQVKLAAQIVLQRVEEVLTMSEFSLAALALLIRGESSEQSSASLEGIAFATDENELGRAMTREGISEARESLDTLRRAVDQWLFEALRRGEAT